MVVKVMINSNICQLSHCCGWITINNTFPPIPIIYLLFSLQRHFCHFIHSFISYTVFLICSLLCHLNWTKCHWIIITLQSVHLHPYQFSLLAATGLGSKVLPPQGSRLYWSHMGDSNSLPRFHSLHFMGHPPQTYARFCASRISSLFWPWSVSKGYGRFRAHDCSMGLKIISQVKLERVF